MKNKINYSRPKIDIENYIDQFFINRNIYYKNSTNKDLPSSININQILIKIENHILTCNKYRPNENTFITFDYLSHIYLYSIKHKKFNSNQLNILYSFQKKFELFKRLYSEYDRKTIKKRGTLPASFNVYSLLSIIFNHKHLLNMNYNAFNTAIKLIDLCLNNYLKTTFFDKKLLEYALILEHFNIKQDLGQITYNN